MDCKRNIRNSNVTHHGGIKNIIFIKKKKKKKQYCISVTSYIMAWGFCKNITGINEANTSNNSLIILDKWNGHCMKGLKIFNPSSNYFTKFRFHVLPDKIMNPTAVKT